MKKYLSGKPVKQPPTPRRQDGCNTILEVEAWKDEEAKEIRRRQVEG